jgi:hypothetical protein
MMNETLTATSVHHGTQHSHMLVLHHCNSCLVMSESQLGLLAPLSEVCHWELSPGGSYVQIPIRQEKCLIMHGLN